MKSNFLFDLLTEHHKYPKGEPIPFGVKAATLQNEILFLGNPEKKCIEVREDNTVHTNYYIGVDWISNTHAIYVAPKLNTRVTGEDGYLDSSSVKETDFLKMLFHCLRYQDIGNELADLFEVKWDKPQIQIEQKQDLLTPLLIIQFLSLIKIIVRKGLKKSYYKVTHNITGRVKGKVLVGRTLKENIFKSKNLNTICSFEEFGLNGFENRVFKLTLSFIQRYLPMYATISSDGYIQNLFNFISPAFADVSEDVDINEVKLSTSNPFYKEYGEAIRLAKLILKRFGYNISNVEKKTVSTHPFWIDMSKLFELYVFGLLRQQFGDKVLYHQTYNNKELDYLLLSPPFVIDAKYKPRYLYSTVLDDARQLSGYSRMHKVYEHLKYPKDKIIDCLIIYPNQESGNKDLSNFCEKLKQPNSIMAEYVNFFKVGIELPVIN